MSKPLHSWETKYDEVRELNIIELVVSSYLEKDTAATFRARLYSYGIFGVVTCLCKPQSFIAQVNKAGPIVCRASVSCKEPRSFRKFFVV